MSYDQFLEFFEAIKAADYNDAETFKRLITESQDVLGLSDEDFGREFEISYTTVARWRSGVAIPLTRLRKLVYEFIQERVLLELSTLE